MLMRGKAIQGEHECHTAQKAYQGRQPCNPSGALSHIYSGDKERPDRCGHHNARRKAEQHFLHLSCHTLAQHQGAGCAYYSSRKGDKEHQYYLSCCHNNSFCHKYSNFHASAQHQAQLITNKKQTLASLFCLATTYEESA